MSNDQLQEDGLASPFELADKSRLDRACEVVLELKALQRQRNRVAAITGIENVTPNPLIDRHMDVDAIRDVFFDDNLQSALSEHFGDGSFCLADQLFCQERRHWTEQVASRSPFRKR